MIHHGDCLDVMAAMEPESVDAIVTDPPYGLEFMGKAWDSFKATGNFPGGGKPTANRADWAAEHPGEGGFTTNGGVPRYVAGMAAQEFHARWAQAAYRVAKPSAYLLAFGGTRTVHRMTVALEDAGWIIRDMLVWGYASGFPKSKASLKPAWEPIVMARKPGPLRMLAIDACRMPVADDDPVHGAVWTARAGVVQGSRPASERKMMPRAEGERMTATAGDLGRWPANIVLTDPIFDGGIEGVVGGGEAGGWYASDTTIDGRAASEFQGGLDRRNGYGDTGTYSRFFTIPEGGTMCEWCGASPAEANSRQRSGPGVSVADPAPTEASSDGTTPTDSPTTSGTEQTSWHDGSGTTSRNTPSPVSRLVVPSRSAPAKSAARPRTSSGITMITESRWMCDSCAEAATRFSMAEQESAARNYPWAFLIPKAARSDREPVLGGLPLSVTKPYNGNLNNAEYEYSDGAHRDAANRPTRANVHPTVKPTDLMRHLVRLVTPQGGTVLDPFLGSGTTGLAAEMEGFAWVGIEREAEYVAIAEARLNGTQKGLGI